MTAKLKAQEIFTEARFHLSLPNAPLRELKDVVAKQISIWRVNGIIDAIKITTDHLTLNSTDISEIHQDVRYWQSVIEEIRKL